jgi:hypothetical protein
MRRTIAAWLAVLALAGIAEAQPPTTSFGELLGRLKVGDAVIVTDDAGETATGRVKGLSDGSMIVQIDGRELHLTERNLQRLTRPRRTILNGALLGLTAGFAAGAIWAGNSECGIVCFSRPSSVLAFGSLFGAIGMGWGAAVGASLPRDAREHVIFERTAANAPPPAADRSMRWFAVYHLGLTSSRADSDLEDAMRSSGYADRSPASFFGPGSDHPFSTGVSSLQSFEVDYRLRPSYGVGLVRTGGTLIATSGYRAGSGLNDEFLDIQHTVTSIAPTISATHGILRGAIGPALHKLRIEQSMPGGGPSESKWRWGFVALAGASLPARSHVFVDVDFQLRYVGRAMVGPYTTFTILRTPGHLFPATNVVFTNWVLGIGPGIRF